MRSLIIYSLLFILSLPFGACEKFLGPVDDNHSGINRVYTDPAIAEGLLLTAYTRIQNRDMDSSDVATDDAVTNDKQNYFLRMATGEWSALFDPISEWDNSFDAIFYINKFLTVVDTVPWSWTNKVVNSMFIRRLKGEAYALRGLAQYNVLVTTGGVGTDGKLLGIPLYDKFITVGENFNIPRAGFNESVNQIYADFDKALEYLTMDDYIDISDAEQLPPGLEGVDIGEYNRVFGNFNIQRISGRIVKALKARVALLAASPAFSPDGNLTLWERAANFAGTSISSIGGIAGLDPDGHMFFKPSIIDKISLPNNDSKEMVWRTALDNTNDLEKSNFPPSLYGYGNINPTQNLVDAFPMINGYPISNPLSAYDPVHPYAGRDPRLSLYIVFNGSSLKSIIIKTGIGGGSNAKDSLSNSTRTGYYLRKFLREDVNVNPTSTNTKLHYSVQMRYTELFLIYAEAANEAWGPDAAGTYGFSARDVIAAIRERAGISQPDNYLTSISSKEDMRVLIHNERRLELCFEGFRFWDLRRWKTDLTETAKGVNINKNNTNFTVVDVESRSYNNGYMHYCPVPKGEIIKFNSLIQNQGW